MKFHPQSAAIVLVTAFACVAPAAGQDLRFEVEEIFDAELPTFTPTAVNPDGLVGGYVGATLDEQRPAVWSAGGGLRLLATADDFDRGAVLSVGESGLLGGRSGGEQGVLLPVLWDSADAEPTVLPVPDDPSRGAAVTGINRVGASSGFATPAQSGGPGALAATTWTAAGELRLLDKLPGDPPPFDLSYANEINNLGVSVGVDFVAVDGQGRAAAVRWSADGTAAMLPLPAGVSGVGQAWDINDASLVTGGAVDSSSDSAVPLFWDAANQVTELLLPAGAETAVDGGTTALDEANRAVASFALPFGERGGIWLDVTDGRAAVLLDDLLAGEFQGINVLDAIDVASDATRVRVTATIDSPFGPRPVLLTAVIPEPSATVGGLLVLGGAALRRRRASGA